MNTTAAPNPILNVGDFLTRVLPWPKADEPGYVNVHVCGTAQDGKKFWSGTPTRTLGEFLDAAYSARSWKSPPDIYMCLSRQGETRVVNGKIRAAKSHEHALAFKSIWLDIDVGKPDAYPTINEALAGLRKFLTAVGLPLPSAVVGSGGGLHVYWVSKTALTRGEWQPFAEGLKAAALTYGLLCDAGCTADAARVLRVPGTANLKLPGRPRPVKLFGLLTEDYEFEKDLAVLRTVDTGNSRIVMPRDPELEGAPLPIFAGIEIDLGARITHEERIVNLDDVAPQCAFIKEALDTGGAAFGQPLWNLTTLIATFTEGGRNDAHRMARGYAQYNTAETDALFDRKLDERANKRLGWPGCKPIQAAGCKSCATCPLLVLGKTPLHFAARPSAPASNTSAQVPITAQFRDFSKDSKPKPSLANAVRAILALGIAVSYDRFHHRILISYKGEASTICEGLLTDDTVSAIRSLINNTYLIDCGEANTLAAIKEIASGNAYDPVLDMLDDCQGMWDGKKRLDTWVIDYLGCEDTPLNRAIGRLVLIAACRRAREPGCKFDNIVVLEGAEGINKSTAIQILAGHKNFSDQSIIGANDKEVQEQLDGVWMHENADLAGMKRADVDHVKAFASRQVDRARPAYGRFREDRPRRSIEWGTTNNNEYLLSPTGNRRFWPLETGKIDIEALKGDREQLLGEAATYEADGESIMLDPSLWNDAREAQEERRAKDPWEDILERKLNLGMMPTGFIHTSGGSEVVASADILTIVLEIPAAQQTSAHGHRLASAMKHVGWNRNKSGRVSINGKPVRGYVRPIQPNAGGSGPAGFARSPDPHRAYWTDGNDVEPRGIRCAAVTARTTCARNPRQLRCASPIQGR
jgi:predicted P-loop ATPase